MVNEIGSVGVASAQGLGYTAGTQTGQVRPPSGPQVPERQQMQVERPKSGFPGLASAKDDAAQVAKSVREADRALRQADALLKDMRSEVKAVKNFPPFPPGNEQRVQYINSLNGLRKEMEALSFPPVESGMEPVFYPRETGLPLLDPKTVSDAEVAAFGGAAEATLGRVEAGYAELRSQAEAVSKRINANLPMPPFEEGPAGEASQAAGGQLGRQGQPILGADNILAQLGG